MSSPMCAELRQMIICKNTFAHLVDDLPVLTTRPRCSSDFDVDYEEYSVKWESWSEMSEADTNVPSQVSELSSNVSVHSEVLSVVSVNDVGTVHDLSSSAWFGPQRTSLMLRNLPNNLSRRGLLELLDQMGFEAAYNFVYLPIDFTRKANRGYAFVNLLDEATACQFFAAFSGFNKWTGASKKVCEVVWSDEQGMELLVQRYRDSAIMHPEVPDECKPAIFQNGVQMAFPAPTRLLRRPQLPAWLRQSASRKA